MRLVKLPPTTPGASHLAEVGKAPTTSGAAHLGEVSKAPPTPGAAYLGELVKAPTTPGVAHLGEVGKAPSTSGVTHLDTDKTEKLFRNVARSHTDLFYKTQHVLRKSNCYAKVYHIKDILEIEVATFVDLDNLSLPPLL